MSGTIAQSFKTAVEKMGELVGYAVVVVAFGFAIALIMHVAYRHGLW